MARRGHRVRIVGGCHRGRLLAVPELPGLRPTGDRIRETLFNWLQPWLPGARCLDLFAGTGALGIEARSRGAAEVVLVEQAPQAVAALRRTLAEWRLERVRLVEADALDWLRRGPDGGPFDIVFLDPPFASDLLATCCALLARGGWLAEGAHVYLEQDVARPLAPLPEGWETLRDKRAGEVCYRLAAVR